MLHSFFSSLARSRYLSILFYLILTLWSVGIHYISSFPFLVSILVTIIITIIIISALQSTDLNHQCSELNTMSKILGTKHFPSKYEWRSPCGIVAKVLDYNIVVSKSELQPYYYIHFQTNTLKEGITPLILMDVG